MTAAADNRLRILLANVRGLSTRKKMEAFKERFLKQNGMDFNLLMLTETHLTKPLDSDGWKVIQTKLDRKGGAAVVSSLRHTKAIKTLGTAIAWASVLIDWQPVHIVSVYLTPNDPKYTNETVQRLLFAIDNVLANLPKSKFIIAGDFNEQRPHVQAKLRARGFKAAIPEGHATHPAGN